MNACCEKAPHVPTRKTLREALLRAGLGGKRNYWRDAAQAVRALDRQQAEKTAGVLPGLECAR